ncbi:MAG: type VI secretion system contractile sheath large subunit [Planctomycetota bacterium]|jgi:type VI secretion system protein ImpC|nr:type VI secretion system contractile sheath large subunit [Planctomycetota bacterium]
MAEAEAAAAQAPVETVSADDFSALLDQEFKPKSTEAKSAVQEAVTTLAAQALAGANIVPDNAITTIEAMIAELDKKLSQQVNAIIHHPDFQKLEGTWRGLHYLINNSETDESLKIRVLNVSKNDLAKTLKKFKGTAWDQSPLFKKIYENEYGTLGGEPYGCLIGDYYFDNSAPDVQMLGELAKIGAAAHAPFIAAPSPKAFNLDSWQELANPRDLTKIFQTPDYAAWRSLRESDDSRYLVMAMPRVLSRLPYGPNTNPVEEFACQETANKHEDFTWMNAAFTMGANINRSFKLYGWCSSIRGVESGGLVPNLPVYTFPSDDGGVDMKCPTEIAITDRREAELSKNGFLPLCHRKGSDNAVFIGAQTLNKPTEYEDPDATGNANLSARLPYIFAVDRFAHYLKCMVRDKIGSFKSRDDMQKYLNNWIMNYVTADPSASEEVKARYPLSAAEVTVKDVEGNPGYYSATFYLKPHYQLEGLTASLRLVTKLPSEKGG